MFETRFLDALIPEFGDIRDRVQFDTYHLFPVGRHSLETVRALKEVGRQKEILLSSVYLELQDSQVLLLAALFHDIGKIGTDHARKGEALVRRMLQRIGLDPARIEDVAFLVRHHLLLQETATRRDLTDEKVVVQCARTIGTPDRLKMLYLLSWADARATGPRAWNDWIGNLVQELFFKVLHILEQGELATPDAAKVAQRVWEDVQRQTTEEIPQDRLEEAFDAMSSRYILNTQAADMIRHIELFGRYSSRRLSSTERAALIVDARKDEAGGCWELTFLARDRPGLFSMIAGALTLNRINILSSDIYTWRDRTAVDVFRVEGPGTGRVPEEVWQKVEQDLSKTLEGKLSLSKRLDQKAGPSVLRRPGRPTRIPEVRVDNKVSDFFTLIEVFANDRVGLLYEITRELTALGLDIRIARISTKADQVADVFYVRDAEGQKMEGAEEIEAIRDALKRRLLQEGKRAEQGASIQTLRR
jgi:[protein-PII] uridylyltransferase